jgi:multidrug efflux pump subunit AcrB
MPEIIRAYPDIRFDFEGQSRETAKTMRAMGKVVPSILILMFLIIVVTFRSFSQAAVVFLLIPFSLIGVAWGHFFRGYIISILSLFGAIALVGIVVNDSLVLVSAMNRILRGGTCFRDALLQAGLGRFRPVLLTSLTTIAGLGPLIFEKSRQAQFLAPMAISVAFGLLFGTLLTLLLLPALLVILSKIKLFFYRIILRTMSTEESVEPAVREAECSDDFTLNH